MLVPEKMSVFWVGSVVGVLKHRPMNFPETWVAYDTCWEGLRGQFSVTMTFDFPKAKPCTFAFEKPVDHLDYESFFVGPNGNDLIEQKC